ncbi:LPS export ABC transporter periplasmic protein LptC [Amorphus orientalis]|uniref:Lipopolysaccharide export system protein LptC n=1 Tax=Amorphus orientalis TaxID=649198 RepID=A0AAE4ARJ2_9HYPH|nr:LPS export ABC transporter periplasmic protein LptC [Amorphus orientalis]MDQ0314113.1 lipopolysaccharide export system protein LptC [Amorphus orientalis]
MTTTDMRFLEHDADAEAEDRIRARASARRHTRFVKTLRVLLPLGGMAIVALIFGTAIVKSFLPVGVGTLNVTSEGLEMNDPNLAGRLNDGRAYKVSAARAMQSFSDTSRITLTDLVATLKASEDQDITVNSRGGLFDTDDEWLTLSDGIVLTTTDGYRADLSSARLDFRNGSMVSDEPVAIGSEKFDLTANSLDVQEEGKVVRFVGDVHLTLHRGPETSSQ